MGETGRQRDALNKKKVINFACLGLRQKAVTRGYEKQL